MTYFIKSSREPLQSNRRHPARVLRGAVSCVALAIALASASTHAVTWTVCNQTPEPLRVAVVVAKDGGYVSEGWWTVRQCGACANVHTGEVEASLAFLRAENKKGVVFDTPDTKYFCVGRNSSFTIRNANKESVCNSRGRSFERFGTHDLKNHKSFTTRLTGKAGSQNVCFDHG